MHARGQLAYARFMRTVLPGIVAVLVGASACGISPGTHGVVIGAGEQTSDTISVVDFDVEMLTLSLTVQHGGGCGEHGYELRWNGQFESVDGVDTAKLVLLHDPHGDHCEALLMPTLNFDLVPVRDEWQRQKGQDSGTVRIRVDGSEHTEELTF
jgi:hypothetical protein